MMTDALEYRPIDADENELFDAYMQYGFSPEDGPPEYDPEDTRKPVGHRRGLYRSPDADPVCICRHYWLEATVRGQAHPAAGLTSVITPPEHRRDGHVSRLLSEILAEYRERGRHFAMLWPFDYGFYRSFGWETANDRRTYECRPDVLSAAVDRLDGAGTYRQIDLDDLEVVDPVYEAHASDYSLTLSRDAAWWRHRVCRARDTEPFVYVWFRGGEPRAYLVYTFEGDYHERTMDVREFGYTDPEGLTAVLAFCYNHDSQADWIRLHAPDDPVVHDRFTAPDEVECELTTGPMVRIVDVAEALTALSYPDGDRQVTLAVDDPFAEWNDGMFGLDASGGQATCRPVGDDRTPDVRIDVGALAQLVVGHRSASELQRAGRIKPMMDAAVETLAALFPPVPVYLRDGF